MDINTNINKFPADATFTIRTAGGKALRKHMSRSRFLSKVEEYRSASYVRVDVTTTKGTQTWDLDLDKRFF